MIILRRFGSEKPVEMFSIEFEMDEDELIATQLTYEGETKIAMFFESVSFEEVDPESENGEITGNEVYNGSFTFAWSSEYYAFEVTHHGEGDSGSLIVKVPVTKGSHESLVSCLRKWKSLVNKNA